MRNCLVWLFGRGASVACNLRWVVPAEWRDLPHHIQEEKIRAAVRNEMNSPSIDTRPYRDLLSHLASRSKTKWHHFFMTTNWDYLLQREIEALGLRVAPDWLPETHVHHINGTVEEWPADATVRKGLRSGFLLETDLPDQRTYSQEVTQAFRYMTWREAFVVAGMSFACPMDKAFLSALRSVEDDLPIGEALWLVLNCNPSALQQVHSLLGHSFPRAEVVAIEETLQGWISKGTPELVSAGILSG